jgi:hypothetical protein
MIHGLSVTITGEELSRRLGDRIRTHEARVVALDTRIEARRGDLPFDIRDEDGFRTVPDLRAEREHYAGRAATLSLLRESLVGEERYVLGKVDLQLAELITVDHIEHDEIPFVPLNEPAPPIDGLKLTFRGEQLRERLAERIALRQRLAERWKGEAARTMEDETEERPRLPAHICENEAEEQHWRAEILTIISEHIDPAATYRLGEDDLYFGDLLPDEPVPKGPCDEVLPVDMISS